MDEKLFSLHFFGMRQEKWIGNDNNPAPIYQPCCHFLNIIFTNMLLQSSGRGQKDDMASSKKTLKCQGKYFVPESWQIYAMNKCLKFSEWWKYVTIFCGLRIIEL